MKPEEFQNKMNSIKDKIGEDASSLILDEIGLLITDNQAMNSSMTEKDNEITRQKKNIETLQSVNANLLQQVSMGNEDDINPQIKEPEKEIPYDFRTAFDEKRKF